ncbi:MAG: Lrp/AsnC family transcriptional regulator [Opitutales bacterium]
MNSVLQLLLQGESLSTAQMADVLGLGEQEVNAQIEELKRKHILLGWRPVFHPEAQVDSTVRAVIEVKITPERGGGFNRLADRISRFEEVESCYLMSGGYDLLAFVRGPSLHQVAAFISERLSTIEGVISTSTHFLLRSYKEQGFILQEDAGEGVKPQVTP